MASSGQPNRLEIILAAQTQQLEQGLQRSQQQVNQFANDALAALAKLGPAMAAVEAAVSKMTAATQQSAGAQAFEPLVQAVQNLAAAFSQGSQAAQQAQAAVGAVGQAAGTADAGVQQLVADLAKMQTENQQLSNSVAQLQQELLKTEAAGQRAGTGVLSLSAAHSEIERVTGAVESFVGKVVSTAVRLDDLQLRLKMATGSAQEFAAAGDAVNEVFEQMKGAVPRQELKAGAAIMERYHVKFSEFGADAAAIAVSSGKSVETVAQAIAKVADGSARSLTQLAAATGKTRDELLLMAGVSPKLAQSTEELQLKQEQLRQLIHGLGQEAQASAGVMGDSMGAATNRLTAQVDDLVKSLGDDALPILKVITEALTATARAANDLPGPVKELGAGLIAFTAATVATVGAVVGLEATLASLSKVFPGLAGGIASTGAAAAAAAPALAGYGAEVATVGTEAAAATPAVAALDTAIAGSGASSILAGTRVAAFGSGLATFVSGSVAGAAAFAAASAAMVVAGVALNEELHKQIDIQKDLQHELQETAHRTTEAAAAMHGDWVGKSAQDLHEMGVSTHDVAQAMGGLQDQIQAAATSTTLSAEAKERLIEKLKAEENALHATGAALGEYQQKVDGASQAVKKLAENVELSRVAYEAGQSSLDDVLASQEAYAASLDHVAGKEKEHLQALVAVNRTRKEMADNQKEALQASFDKGDIDWDQYSAGVKRYADELRAIPGHAKDADRALDELGKKQQERDKQAAASAKAAADLQLDIGRERNIARLQDDVRTDEESLASDKAGLEEKRKLHQATVADEQQVTDDVIALTKARGVVKVAEAESAVAKAREEGRDVTIAEDQANVARAESQKNLTKATTEESHRRREDQLKDIQEVQRAQEEADKMLEGMQKQSSSFNTKLAQTAFDNASNKFGAGSPQAIEAASQLIKTASAESQSALAAEMEKLTEQENKAVAAYADNAQKKEAIEAAFQQRRVQLALEADEKLQAAAK